MLKSLFKTTTNIVPLILRDSVIAKNAEAPEHAGAATLA